MQALVSDHSNEKLVLVEKLVKGTAGTGWMHESFDANNPEMFSRPWFCWPDSLFSELVMSLVHECPQADVSKYKVKEWRDKDHMLRGEFLRRRMIDYKFTSSTAFLLFLMETIVSQPFKYTNTQYLF